MKDYVTITIGLFLALFVPGAFLVWGLTPLVPATAFASIGGDSARIFWLLVCVLGAGGGIGGLREISLDNVFRRWDPKGKWEFFVIPPENRISFQSLVGTGGVLETYRVVVEEFWRYYCFYGSSFLAVSIVMVARYKEIVGWWWALAIAVVLLLLLAAIQAWGCYRRCTFDVVPQGGSNTSPSADDALDKAFKHACKRVIAQIAAAIRSCKACEKETAPAKPAGGLADPPSGAL